MEHVEKFHDYRKQRNKVSRQLRLQAQKKRAKPVPNTKNFARAPTEFSSKPTPSRPMTVRTLDTEVTKQGKRVFKSRKSFPSREKYWFAKICLHKMF